MLIHSLCKNAYVKEKTMLDIQGRIQDKLLPENGRVLKIGSAEIGTCKKISKWRNNWERFNMFKATEAERKTEKWNYLRSANKSLIAQSYKPLFLSLSSDCHANQQST